MFANGKWDSDQKLWTITACVARIKSVPLRVQEEVAKPKPAKQRCGALLTHSKKVISPTKG
jgi:hypothetical protein